MYEIDLNKPVHAHFIGIGGISMSGLAKLLLSKSFKISGSDETRSDLTDELTRLGANVAIGQSSDNITSNIDVVIYTGSISEENPEFAAAKKSGLPLLTRGQLMGQIMKNYPHVAGISGTDGKTTTTSLLSMLLINAGYDPTISVGGIIPEINTNFKIGKGTHFIAESCEYTNSFLDFFPTDAIILNIREDHLDFFKDIDDIRNSFAEFCRLVPSDGLAVINSEIENYRELFRDVRCNIKTYGLAESSATPNEAFDYTAANISYDALGHGSYDLYEEGRLLGRVKLALVGRHNVSNSLAAIAMALHYGVSFDEMLPTLAEFSGAKRRFEYKGEKNGMRIYDDYAHNPSEIKVTLTAALQYEHKRLITVFQPHTYSRTKALLSEFADALMLSDVVIFADIYAAREIDDGSVSSGSIKELLDKKGKEAYYFHSFKEIENFLSDFSTPGDMLITMGAGNVVNVGDDLLHS